MRLLGVALFAVTLPGCVGVPEGQSAVDSIRFEGERALSERELKELLATQQTR